MDPYVQMLCTCVFNVLCCMSGRPERCVVVTCLVFRSVEKQRQSLQDPDSITN